MSLKTSDLNADQQGAKDNLIARLELGVRHVSLTGHAGSGKTFLAGNLLRSLSTKYDVYACAPTHKAAYVLDKKLPADAQTIHSFLGLVIQRDGSGGYYLTKNNKSKTPETGIVLLDESSMVGTNLWKWIEHAKGLQWVFVGDPAQLPPVKQHPSPALSVPGPGLTEIVRQERGNPILQFATSIRQGESGYLKAAEYDGGRGVALVKSVEAFGASAARAFRNADPDQPPDCRMLAYRNVMVDHYNARIRHLLHGEGDLPRFIPGDWLMMSDTYFEEDAPETGVKNAEEVKVLHVGLSSTHTAGGSWKIWNLTVQRERGMDAVLPVLHEHERMRYRGTLAQFKQEAIKKKRPWRDYYDLLEHFAKLDYCYALTVHRSQGSTYRTVYIDHRDLCRCKGPEERALKYVAATRASERMAVLV